MPAEVSWQGPHFFIAVMKYPDKSHLREGCIYFELCFQRDIVHIVMVGKTAGIQGKMAGVGGWLATLQSHSGSKQ